MILSEAVQDYISAHTTEQDKVLNDLERATFLRMLSPVMASGHYQGQLLKMICQMTRPKVAVEIGTFTGYAAICLSEGLAEDGVLHSIEVNEENEDIIREFWQKAGIKDKVQLHIGDAFKVIPSLPTPIDLVFIDAGKDYYAGFFDLIIDKMRAGGVILADNVLWSGKVLKEKKNKDERNLDAFNKKIQNDPRVENIILPIRDGLLLAIKK